MCADEFIQRMNTTWRTENVRACWRVVCWLLGFGVLGMLVEAVALRLFGEPGEQGKQKKSSPLSSPAYFFLCVCFFLEIVCAT
jgi:hypothetical protein